MTFKNKNNNIVDVQNIFYCFNIIFLHFFIVYAYNSNLIPGGDSAYERGGDARHLA